jgi:hypothetical protein
VSVKGVQVLNNVDARNSGSGVQRWGKGNSAFEISGSGVEKRVERRSGFEGIEIRIMIAS